jgi:hypothetical protein
MDRVRSCQMSRGIAGGRIPLWQVRSPGGTGRPVVELSSLWCDGERSPAPRLGKVTSYRNQNPKRRRSSCLTSRQTRDRSGCSLASPRCRWSWCPMTKTRRAAAWWRRPLARAPLVAPGGVKGRWSGDLEKETGRSRSPEDQPRARLVWRGFLGATGLKVALVGTAECPEDWWGSGL